MQGSHIIIDDDILSKVANLSTEILSLSDSLSRVLLECHQIDELKNYIKKCRQVTNYDLSEQIWFASEKL